MTPSRISPELLDKYLNNQCTDRERQQVENWYASLSRQPDYLDTLPEHEQRLLQDETLANIKDQLHQQSRPKERKLPWGWLSGLAASVLLVAGIYITYNSTAYKNVPVATHIQETDPVNIIRFVNSEPRVVMHRLPDSSTVWMHTDASISYPKEFEKNKRAVSFSGEGFFDIKKDKSRPFSIHSGELSIRVLGTSFNVKAPASKKIFQISVVTGRVEVSVPDKQQKQQLVVLKPKQEAFFEIGSRRLVFSPVPLQSKKQIYEPVTIVFEETPLNEAISQLEKRFDITIRLSNPEVSSCRVSGDFEKESLPAIMEMLCTTLEASYTMSGNTMTIEALPCR